MPTAATPTGRQDRANCRVASTTNRASTTRMYRYSTYPTKAQTSDTAGVPPPQQRTGGAVHTHNARAPSMVPAARQPPPALPAAARSGLVEEPALDPRLVLRRDFDVVRAEQEHLRGDTLNTAVQPEGQSGGEVDQSLR